MSNFKVEFANGTVKEWEGCEDQKGWGVYTSEILGDTSCVNLIPENDIKEHSFTRGCECCPDVYVEDMATNIVHNSFDKRELLEDLDTKEVN